MASRLSTTALAAVLAGGLALSGAVAVPASAASVSVAPASVAQTTPVAVKKAVKKASLTVSKKRVTTLQKPFPHKSTVRMPVLKGSTAKNRALVSKSAKALLAAERVFVAKWRKSCNGKLPGDIRVTDVSKSIYKKRYASVTMAFSSDAGCRGVTHQNARSFTIDLKTGKRVRLSKFAASSAQVTRAAFATALKEQNRECVYDEITAIPGQTWSMPTPSGWNVTSKGVRVWFGRYEVAYGACGAVSALVPWRDVASAAQLKGKRQSRIYVHGLKKSEGAYTGDIVVLTSQGRQVATMFGALGGGAHCTVGIRTGKKVRGFAPEGGDRLNFTLAGTTKKPSLELGKGWRLATAKEIAAFKKASTKLDAIKACA